MWGRWLSNRKVLLGAIVTLPFIAALSEDGWKFVIWFAWGAVASNIKMRKED
jgi:hypothetical protein